MPQNEGYVQMSMRNGVTPKLYIKTKTNTNPDPNRYRRSCPDPNARIQKFIHSWQQHHNCRIVCELSLRILICILPQNDIILCWLLNTVLFFSFYNTVHSMDHPGVDHWIQRDHRARSILPPTLDPPLTTHIQR